MSLDLDVGGHRRDVLLRRRVLARFIAAVALGAEGSGLGGRPLCCRGSADAPGGQSRCPPLARRTEVHFESSFRGARDYPFSSRLCRFVTVPSGSPSVTVPSLDLLLRSNQDNIQMLMRARGTVMTTNQKTKRATSCRPLDIVDKLRHSINPHGRPAFLKSFLSACFAAV